MKRLFLLLFTGLLVITNSLQAQMEKGTLFLAGSLGYNTYSFHSGNTFDNNQTGFFINPKIGKAIKNNLAAGILLRYIYQDNKDKIYMTGNRSNTYGAGVFVRKYKDLGKNFYLFGESQLYASLAAGKNFYNNPVTISKSNGYAVDLALYPGLAYALSHHLQIEAAFYNLVGVYFSHTRATNTSSNTSKSISDTFGINTSLSNLANSLSIGILVLLNKGS